MSRHPQRGSGRSIDVPPNRMADTGRIYLFRKNMVRPGWGNHALKRGRRHTSPPRTTILERFPEQLNAHSEQLNAAMCHHDTILVAFTLGSDPLESGLSPVLEMATEPSRGLARFSSILPLLATRTTCHHPGRSSNSICRSPCFSRTQSRPRHLPWQTKSQRRPSAIA